MKRAYKFAECAEKMLAKPIDAIVFDSYARGGLGEWNDIDLLVLVKGLSENLLERLRLVEKCLEEVSDVEPLILKPRKASSRLSVGDPVVK